MPFESSRPASVQALGEEFQVNSYVTGSQYSPDVARDGAGNFIVVWTSVEQDGDGAGIFAQRYNSDGLESGGEFQVNTYTNDRQSTPGVSMNAAGEFVVVWESREISAQYSLVRGRRFDSTGMPVGLDFEVSTSSSTYVTKADVAVSDSGAFMVFWTGYDNSLNGGIPRGCLFASDGSPEAAPFALAGSSYYLTYPAGDVDADGNFIIVWDHPSSNGPIEARRDDSTGSLLLEESLEVGYYPKVVATDGGGFNVAYQIGIVGQDVVLRRYDSAGTPLGSEVLVNTYTTGAQRFPDLAIDSSGNMIVTWSSAQDGDSGSVHGQRFASDGIRWGGELLVNTCTTGFQGGSAVAADPSGAFVVAWQAPFGEATLTNTVSVASTSFDPNLANNSSEASVSVVFGLFFDGFESGDTSGWSLVVEP